MSYDIEWLRQTVLSRTGKDLTTNQLERLVQELEPNKISSPDWSFPGGPLNYLVKLVIAHVRNGGKIPADHSNDKMPFEPLPKELYASNPVISDDRWADDGGVVHDES